jgi:imidazolonepropionase-like amidohydrolase
MSSAPAPSAAPASSAAPAPAPPLVLRGVRALDEGGSFSDAVDVAVVDGVIAEVGAGLRTPDGAAQVDGDGLWLMPGVFDCHTHLGMSTGDTLQNLQTPITLRTLKTAANLRATLEAGVTHARDAGGVDAGMRMGVEQALIAGPTLDVSVVMLGQTGGHSDGFLCGPGVEISVEDFSPLTPSRPHFLVDGPDEMRRRVRELLRAGADWIKLCTTGGVFEGADAANATELSVEEVAVAVVEAERRGRGVMCHAVGAPGIDVALEAGVRSIEHGIHLTEEQAARMGAAGTFLVPTLVIYHQIVDMVRAAPDAFPPALRSSVADIAPTLGACVRLAHEHGVPIALGTDLYTTAGHGGNLAEITHLHRAGLPVEAALLAATTRGAQLCGVAATEGRIAPGYAFDALLLDADPGDLSCFLDRDAVTGVFQRGAAIVEHRRVTAASR